MTHINDGPFCTHQMVRLTPHIHEDGHRTDHWLCECGQEFMIPSVEAEAARQTEQELREAQDAIRLLAVSLSECVRWLRVADWYAQGTARDAQAAIQRAEALLAQAERP